MTPDLEGVATMAVRWDEEQACAAELALELRLWTPGWALVAAAIQAQDGERTVAAARSDVWGGLERRSAPDRRTGRDRRATSRSQRDRRSGYDRRGSPVLSA